MRAGRREMGAWFTLWGRGLWEMGRGFRWGGVPLKGAWHPGKGVVSVKGAWLHMCLANRELGGGRGLLAACPNRTGAASKGLGEGG